MKPAYETVEVSALVELGQMTWQQHVGSVFEFPVEVSALIEQEQMMRPHVGSGFECPVEP